MGANRLFYQSVLLLPRSYDLMDNGNEGGSQQARLSITSMNPQFLAQWSYYETATVAITAITSLLATQLLLMKDLRRVDGGNHHPCFWRRLLTNDLLLLLLLVSRDNDNDSDDAP
jgi:hypothetical protein